MSYVEWMTDHEVEEEIRNLLEAKLHQAASAWIEAQYAEDLWEEMAQAHMDSEQAKSRDFFHQHKVEPFVPDEGNRFDTTCSDLFNELDERLRRHSAGAHEIGQRYYILEMIEAVISEAHLGPHLFEVHWRFVGVAYIPADIAHIVDEGR